MMQRSFRQTFGQFIKKFFNGLAGPSLGTALGMMLVTGCDLLFVPEIFPPQMDLIAPTDTVWLRSGRDTLDLEFRIMDEDGDLGRDTMDQTKDLWMLEVRYGSPPFDSTLTEYEYVIPNLTPKGANKRVDASLKVRVEPLTLRSGLVVDSSKFYVVLRDRAGNFCPVIELPLIYLRP
jgi:hypothetical protein